MNNMHPRKEFSTLVCLIRTSNPTLQPTLSNQADKPRSSVLTSCHYLQGEALYFTPISLINFYLIPLRFRVIFIGSAQLGWAMFISAVQHELPDITTLWVSIKHIIN